MSLRIPVIIVSMAMIASVLSEIPIATGSEFLEATNSDGFDWHIVPGWNIVSVPTEPPDEGTNGFFDAYDALKICHWQMPWVTELSLFDRIGGNPSTFDVFDYGMSETGAFQLDGVHAYWLYTDGSGIIHFNGTQWPAGGNVLNLYSGWNLVGFTHNGTWSMTPTASDFCDGTIAPQLLSSDKVIASRWVQSIQSWDSYVDSSMYPGMTSHNWAWDFSYSTRPGNGFMLWVECPMTITFNQNFNSVPINESCGAALPPSEPTAEPSPETPPVPTAIPLPEARAGPWPIVSSIIVTPDPHDGNVASEQVVIQATLDSSAVMANIIAANCRIDGGTQYAMYAQDGTFDEMVEVVTYTYQFPIGFSEGYHTVEIIGADTDGWNFNWTVDAFQVIDTTDPIVAWLSTPGPTIYTTETVFFTVGYEDFTAYDPSITNSYIEWRLNNGTWNRYAWTNDSFAWGSYQNILTYSIPGGTFIMGDHVDYRGVVSDTAASPNSASLIEGSFDIPICYPIGPGDPYPVHGFVWLYNGAGGAYSPIASSGGAIATAKWISTFDGSTLTWTDTTNALGQYSIDLSNYTDGTTVELESQFNAPYNNMGYNYTTVDLTGEPGASFQEIICGVPYEVKITNPIPGALEMPGALFPATYVIYDRDGSFAQGYYTFSNGPMEWSSSDITFVPPAMRTFSGIASPTPGYASVNLQLFTSGPQYLNVSEGGPDEFNPYLTPWGSFNQIINGVTSPGWKDDWDNITVIVQGGGGFDWNIVEGWNLVSCPMSTYETGSNGYFDSYDALKICHWQIPWCTELSLLKRLGGNPSTWQVFDYGMPESSAFPLDGVHSYFVYSDVAGICHFNGSEWPAGSNTLTLQAGWNTVGFTHDYTMWLTTPTAQMFTNGYIDADLDINGPLTKIIASQWDFIYQKFDSYVVTDTYPGIASKNWQWDFTYSMMPGNGLMLWVNQPVTITFNTWFSNDPVNEICSTVSPLQTKKGWIVPEDGPIPAAVPPNPAPRDGFWPAVGPITITPDPHDGNTVSEQVTVSTTFDSSGIGCNVVAANCRIDGGTSYAMTAQDGAFDEMFEIVTYTYNFPPGFADGVHTVEVIGADEYGWNFNWTSDIFTVTDMTDPIVAWLSTPPATIFTTQPVNFIVGYEDFTAYNTNIAYTHISWQVNGGGYINYPLTNASFSWGSYQNILTYTIPANTFVLGDWVDYTAQIGDTATAPNIGILASGSFQVGLLPPWPDDPYPIYGFVYENGLPRSGGDTVQAEWVDDISGIVVSQTGSTNSLSQYSVDLYDYFGGSPVWANATGAPDYTGFNTTAVVIPQEGGEYVNINSIQSSPFMEITKEGPAYANSGEAITYWINYTNVGTDTAYNVSITETYPAGVTFVSSVPAPTFGDNVWFLGSIGPGVTGSIAVTVLVNPSAIGTLLNSVVLDYEDGGGVSQPPVSDMCMTEIVDPYMTITKTGPATANPGETITYTITCQNLGTDTAYNVVITDAYSPDVTFVNSIPLPTIWPDVWFIGNIPPAATYTITITVQVSEGTAGNLPNFAELYYEDGMGETQPPVNANCNTTIVNPLMLITKIGPVTASPGDTIVYWLNYTNAGTDWAYNVTVTETYPPNVTFISAIPAPSMGNNVWFIGALAPSASGSIMITVQVNAGASGNITNFVQLDYENSVMPLPPVIASCLTSINPSTGPVHNLDTDDYFNEIQAAIDDPDTLSGHTILVSEGTYCENVNINKSLILIGQNRNTTIIDGGFNGNVLYVCADWANIRDFTLRNGSSGIQITTSDFCTVENVTTYNNDNFGIFLAGSNYNAVKNCSSFDNTDGILLDGSDNNSIEGNTVWNNQWGIYLDTSSTNLISYNYVYSTNKSLTLVMNSYANTITDNDVSDNAYGIQMGIGVTGNEINHNSIINNGLQAWDPNPGANLWDNGYPSGGNFWSDYSGTDMFSGPGQDIPGGDGIGDTPYVFNFAQDNYPIWPYWTTDTSPPQHLNEHPPAGGESFNLTPVISVDVIDILSGVNASTIRLYVGGFMIFYSLAAISDGFTVSYWHEAGFTEGQNVSCRIVAKDYLGNTLDFTWFFTAAIGESFIITLHDGWNLLSFPLIPLDTSIENLLFSISGNWDVAKWYDPNDPSDPWKTYRPDSPSNDLMHIDNTMGFWLHVTNSSSDLIIYGNEPVTTNILLKAGWNLVSCPSSSPNTVSTALWGTGADRVEAYDNSSSTLLRELGPGDLMEPGKGYWVHVVAEAIWTVAY